jgi:hypothetical protein
MKTLKFLALLCILLGFAVNTSQAQAIVMTEDENDGRIPTFWDEYPAGVWHKYTSTDWHLVITPSGNINGTITFNLNPEDPLVPDNGSNTFTMVWRLKDDEGIIHVTTAYAIVTADGKMRTITHFKPEKE